MSATPQPFAEPLGEWFRREVLPRLTVGQAYGDDVKWRKAGAWFKRPCPLHAGRGYNFHVHTETLMWRCHSACGEGGDAVRFTERSRGVEFVEAVRYLAGLVGVELPKPGKGTRSKRAPGHAPAKPRAVAPPPLPRPPPEEVEGLWSASSALSAAPAASPAGRFLASRGWSAADVELLSDLDLARFLPRPEAYAFPEWWPGSWASTWRLVVRAWEPSGTLAAVHARAILPDTDPKTRWPLGLDGRFRYGDLLFADVWGEALLRGGDLPGGLEAVVVVEGLTGFLNFTLRAKEAGRHVAVLGITSGSTPALRRVPWPTGLRCLVATDDTDAPPAKGGLPTGERYAREVVEALRPRGVLVERVRFNEKRTAAEGVGA